MRNIDESSLLESLCRLLNHHIELHPEDKEPNKNKVELINSILESLGLKPVKLVSDRKTDFNLYTISDISTKTIEELKKKVAEERKNGKKEEEVAESVIRIKKEGEKTSLLQKIIKLIVRAISYILRKLLQGTSALYNMIKSAITRKENPLNLGKDSVKTKEEGARPR